MKYLTKLQPVVVVVNNSNNVTDQTRDTLVADISEILVEVKEIRKLDVCSFCAKFATRGFYIKGLCLCKHVSGQVMRVALFSSWKTVERKYVFTLRIVLKDRSGVAVYTGIVRRMVIIVSTSG